VTLQDPWSMAFAIAIETLKKEGWAKFTDRSLDSCRLCTRHVHAQERHRHQTQVHRKRNQMVGRSNCSPSRTFGGSRKAYRSSGRRTGKARRKCTVGCNHRRTVGCNHRRSTDIGRVGCTDMFHNSWTSSNALSNETSSGQIKRIRVFATSCMLLCQP